MAHILLVEDEEHLAIGIQYNLKAEGYQVTTVDDGRAALQRVLAGDDLIDLVVLDLMLPGMSGYDVCEGMRSVGNETPVLILSARTLTEDRTRGFNVGANQYLTKPFELDELLSRIKNLLLYARPRTPREAAASPPREPFAFANATVNFETFEVIVADQPVRMTRLEMQLLEYFIANEGRVIPRQELLQNVWGVPGNLNTRAPDQFIRRLRKTFEPEPAKPRYFLTIRDAGYRFVAAGEPR
jgi:two-component system, OmpR family, alkaline phosphatase synthesis response regulator PhoP